MDRIRPDLTTTLAAALAALLLAPVATAAPPPSQAPEAAGLAGLRERLVARLPGCDCESGAELRAKRDEIAAAADVEAARALALSDVTLARRALGTARRLAPFSDELAEAHRRIERYEDEVKAAPDVAAVTLRFEDFVQVASAGDVIGVDGDFDGGDGVHGKRFGCALSTGELIAVILGFILGIIPGIILILLLC